MKIVSLVGARPNFVKIAPVLRQFQGLPQIQHLLVHSGQHYDEEMSNLFFRELGIPEPDVNLQVGSGTNIWQTAEVMQRLEPVLLDFKPQLVIVVGDVNSTLAGALAAVKLGIRLAHIEAGLRSFDSTMPEETNRKLTDAVGDLLFVSEESGVRNLGNEGIPPERVFLVGNVMIDTLLHHLERAAHSNILEELGVLRDSVAPYALLTLHRPSNVEDPEILHGLLTAVANIAEKVPVFFPIHPRTRERIQKFGFLRRLQPPGSSAKTGIIQTNPLAYLDFLCLMKNARLVLTDSGGIQEETTVLKVPCLTLRENTERPATVEYGTNQVVGANPQRIVAAAEQILRGNIPNGRRPPLWDGCTAKRIVDIMLDQKFRQ